MAIRSPHNRSESASELLAGRTPSADFFNDPSLDWENAGGWCGRCDLSLRRF
jgi:hypothetical protein